MNIEEAVICDEMDYDVINLAENVEETVLKFMASQQEDKYTFISTHNLYVKYFQAIYDTFITAVRQQESLQVFIFARGGCGKTFLLNALLDTVRSLEPGGCVALAKATTGIAAHNILLKAEGSITTN